MSLLILYGSETGTAQDTAETLRREGILQGLSVRLQGLDEYDVDQLPNERLVLFVVATTGQGELPPNMRSSWRKLLRRSLPNSWLTQTMIAVFGLGDSSYQKYNFAGKKLYRRLLQLGASEVIPLGLGDDQHEIGLDGAFTPWKQSLWEVVYQKKIFENMKDGFDPATPLPPRFVLTDVPISKTVSGTSYDRFYELPLLRNERCTSLEHFQDTRLFEFEIPSDYSTQFIYKPGDVLMVRPYNLPETIDIAINAMGFTDEVLDNEFYIHPNDPFLRTPPTWLIGEKTTIRTCLTRLFDLQMIPRKSFFETLGSISTNEMEKERLLELGSPQGIDDLLDYCVRCKRTVAETLRDFPATAKNITPDRLFDIFSYIRPRAFSIASNLRTQPNRIELLVARVEYKSRISVPRRGLCSNFLSSIQPGQKVFARVRVGTFNFPSNPEVPVLCVGPGTGVAPFRSYLNWRDDTPSSSILFFGARGSTKDFYFADEWPKMSYTKLFTAFSRDQEKKIYVQNVMAQNAAEIWKLIGANTNGMVFVAGSSGDMPEAVADVLNKIAEKYGFEGSYVQLLEGKGRLQYETWS